MRSARNAQPIAGFWLLSAVCTTLVCNDLLVARQATRGLIVPGRRRPADSAREAHRLGVRPEG